jgi:hypothetical protein
MFSNMYVFGARPIHYNIACAVKYHGARWDKLNLLFDGKNVESYIFVIESGIFFNRTLFALKLIFLIIIEKNGKIVPKNKTADTSGLWRSDEFFLVNQETIKNIFAKFQNFPIYFQITPVLELH